MNRLQQALGMNAFFSGISGILLLLVPNWLATLFELQSSSPFWIIGFGLLFFAGTIVLEIYKQRLVAVLWIILQDVMWVLGSLLILVIQPFGISIMGHIIIAFIAFVVFLMALNQAFALAQADRIHGKSSKQFRFERAVRATKKEVWKLITDVANYHRVAPNIDAVKIISGEGAGMVRSCTQGKNSWKESCTSWEEGSAYSFLVNTSAPDYPYPFKYLKGTWAVLEEGPHTARIVVNFEFEYKFKIQNILLHPFLAANFKKIMEKLLNNWQDILEKEEQPSQKKEPWDFPYAS